MILLLIFLPLNFKESFFNYFNLREKVADFSEWSSQRFLSAVGVYWKHCLWSNMATPGLYKPKTLLFLCTLQSWYIFSLNQFESNVLKFAQKCNISTLWKLSIDKLTRGSENSVKILQNCLGMLVSIPFQVIWWRNEKARPKKFNAISHNYVRS